MRFNQAPLHDALLIDPEPFVDSRGLFARVWCADEFEAHGLDLQFVQANTAYSAHRGTVRGMHYQAAPHTEAKFIRCTRGAIFDVIVDLRTHSPTYKQWFGVELNEDNRRALYVPEGFAHGYQSLTDGAEVFYLVTARHAPQAERGLRYDDPAFDIAWPADVTAISDKDKSWAAFEGGMVLT